MAITLSPVMPAGTTSVTTPSTRPTASATPTPKPAAAETATPAPKAEISPEMSALMLENTKLKRQYDMKTKESALERRKWDGEKKTFSEKMKDAENYARLKREAPINRVAVAKELWGDKWYEQLTEAQLSGGAPTAESVQHELDRRDALLREEIAKRDQAAQEQTRAQREAAAQQELRKYAGEVAAQVKAAADEFPLLLKTFNGEVGAANALVSRIHAQWLEARKEDPAAKPMAWKEAATQLENQFFSLAEHAASHAKYAPKLKEKLTPAPVSGGNAQSKVQQPSGSQLQQSSRKTLSNDLTASTQSPRAPAIDDEERMRRARERYDAVIASRAT